jgi:PP-loop superfamily ATP-utilizing enzyme
MLKNELAARYTELERVLKELGSVLIAFSGGVDSTLLDSLAQKSIG